MNTDFDLKKSVFIRVYPCPKKQLVTLQAESRDQSE
jgi:hypothetical protein